MREKAIHQQRMLEEDTQRKLMEAQQQALVMQQAEQSRLVSVFVNELKCDSLTGSV